MGDEGNRKVQIPAFAAKNGPLKAHYPLPITHFQVPVTHYRFAAIFLAATISGCGTIATREPPPPIARAPDSTPAQVKPGTKPGGGYYLNDGPGDNPPPCGPIT